MSLLGNVFKALDYGHRNGGLLGLGSYAFNPDVRAAEQQRQQTEASMLRAQQAQAQSLTDATAKQQEFGRLLAGENTPRTALASSAGQGLLGPTRHAAGLLEQPLAQDQDPFAFMPPQLRQFAAMLPPAQALDVVAGAMPKPLSPKDRYMNVPDVGLVDIGGEAPQVAIGARDKPQGFAADLLAAGIDPMSERGRQLFGDYLARKGGGVNVTLENMGNIPAGYELFTTPDGTRQMRPIPGSPAALESESKDSKERAAAAAKAIQGDLVTGDISRALDQIGSASFPVTGMGSLLSAVPGTPAHDLSQILNTVRSNIGFDKLQAMRENSPTGGALGAVSDFENRQLQATFGALEQSQSREQLLYNLARLNNLYLDIVHGAGEGKGRIPMPASPEEREKLPPGTRYMAPDGSWRVRQ